MPRLLTIAAIVVLAASRPGAAENPPTADREVERLVTQLGSPEFARREAAAKKLRTLRGKALAAVTVGTKSSDPEVGRRCQDLVKQIWADHWAARDNFADGKTGWPGPGWKAFKSVVGDSPTGRKLFVVMVEYDRQAELADQAAADPAAADKLYAAELARVRELWGRVSGGFSGEPESKEAAEGRWSASMRMVRPCDVISLLFLGSFPLPDGAPDPAEVEFMLRARFIQLARGPLQEPFHKLFAAWLDRRRDPLAIEAGLDGALHAGVREAVPVARRVAADRKALAPAVGPALLVLGGYGGAEDLSRLAARRDDARAYLVVQPTADGPRFEIQVREAAAAMSLLLRGQDVEEYGFRRESRKSWWAGPHPRPAPFKSLSWFEKADARDVALRKAWDWLDRQAR